MVVVAAAVYCFEVCIYLRYIQYLNSLNAAYWNRFVQLDKSRIDELPPLPSAMKMYSIISKCFISLECSFRASFSAVSGESPVHGIKQCLINHFKSSWSAYVWNWHTFLMSYSILIYWRERFFYTPLAYWLLRI